MAPTYSTASTTTKGLVMVSTGVAAVACTMLYYVWDRSKKSKMELTNLRFNYSVEKIQKETQAILDKWKQVEDIISAILIEGGEKVTYENSAQLLAELDRELSTATTNVTFLAHVSADKKIRDACTEAETLINEYQVISSMRSDVYEVIKALRNDANIELKGEKKRYVDRLIRDFERNGLHLAKETQEKIAAAKQRLSKLSIEYQKNLGEENTILEFTDVELDGLSEDFLSSLQKVGEGSDKLKVPLKYPQVFPILKQCHVPSTRQAVQKAFNQRCMFTNSAILQEMVKLRHEVASLMKYSNHSSYVLETRMAKTPTNVNRFLNDLNDKLTPLAKKELQELLLLKKQTCKERNFLYDGKINMWDYHYYMNMREKNLCNFDQEDIRQYFPLDHVTKALLKMYETILSLKYVRVDGAHVWHPEVSMYQVLDARSGSIVGYFYLDLFPRDGKYGHAACFGLQPSCVSAKTSQRQVPVAAMVTNFNAPTDKKPSLLNHREVVTFFHEFGHVMHQICSEAELRIFAGTAVERDFVEAPSQMLENWCWEKEILKKLSGHYTDTSQPLPDDLIDRLIASRDLHPGLLNKRQMLFAMFDQAIHTKEKVNIVKTLKELHRDIFFIDMTPDTNFAASFGHIAGGYDAQYYGYLWSEVFSMDMFMSRFKAEGLMNTKVGLDYRMKILACGGSKDASEMLKDFLGREPNDEAFLRSKGL